MVAGTGTPGFSGDGHAAVHAELDEPFGVGVDAAGNLLIAGRHYPAGPVAPGDNVARNI